MYRVFAFLVLSAIVCAAASTATHAGIVPSFMGLGDLPTGDYFSSANDVSADGRYVVGHARRLHPVSGGNADTAVRWDTTTGDITILHEDRFGQAYAISSDGTTAVGSTNNNPTIPYRWTDATGPIRIGSVGTTGAARGVSANGSVVVGTRVTSTLVGGDVVETSDAFKWTSSGGFVGLGTLGGTHSFGADVSADGSVVVGSADTSGVRHAFRWDSQAGMTSLGMLPGFTVRSSAAAISADGTFVVGSSIGPNVSGAPTSQAYIWSQATGLTGLGDLPGGHYFSEARDVSADGSVVVGIGTRSGLSAEAMIWDRVNGMRHLKDVLQNDYGLDLSGWTLHQANGISDDGKTIVGYGIHSGFGGEAWVVHIPEPASSILILTVFLVYGLRKPHRTDFN